MLLLEELTKIVRNFYDNVKVEIVEEKNRLLEHSNLMKSSNSFIFLKENVFKNYCITETNENNEKVKIYLDSLDLYFMQTKKVLIFVLREENEEKENKEVAYKAYKLDKIPLFLIGMVKEQI